MTPCLRLQYDQIGMVYGREPIHPDSPRGFPHQINTIFLEIHMNILTSHGGSKHLYELHICQPVTSRKEQERGRKDAYLMIKESGLRL